MQINRVIFGHHLAITGHVPIYFASPSVFLHDDVIETYHEHVRSYALERGINLLMPYVFNGYEPDDIYSFDKAMLRSSAGAIANIDPFMGGEPDSGVAWEIGYLCALNKPVVSFGKDTRCVGEKHKPFKSFQMYDNGVLDKQFETEYKPIEHSVKHNLMISNSTTFVYSSALEAIDKMVTILNTPQESTSKRT